MPDLQDTLAHMLNQQSYLLRKWAKNLAPSNEYIYPAELAAELVRMADTLDSCADALPEADDAAH